MSGPTQNHDQTNPNPLDVGIGKFVVINLTGTTADATISREDLIAFISQQTGLERMSYHTMPLAIGEISQDRYGRVALLAMSSPIRDRDRPAVELFKANRHAVTFNFRGMGYFGTLVPLNYTASEPATAYQAPPAPQPAPTPQAAPTPEPAPVVQAAPPVEPQVQTPPQQTATQSQQEEETEEDGEDDAPPVVEQPSAETDKQDDLSTVTQDTVDKSAVETASPSSSVSSDAPVLTVVSSDATPISSAAPSTKTIKKPKKTFGAQVDSLAEQEAELAARREAAEGRA